METRAAATGAFTLAGLGKATETAIVELEFSFWMTRGERDCGMVPLPTAIDGTLFHFLDQTSPPSGYSDDSLLTSTQQYTYQSLNELGYPVLNHAFLDDLMTYSYEDFLPFLPGPAPAYDPTAERDLAQWLSTTADHILFVGGEWDPWSAGYPAITTTTDSFRMIVSHGSHWSSGIYSVTTAEQATAVAALHRWTGTTARAALPKVAAPLAPLASAGPGAPHRGLRAR